MKPSTRSSEPPRHLIAPVPADRRRDGYRLVVAFGAVGVLGVVALSVGRPMVAPWDLTRLDPDDGVVHLIVTQIRAPRAMLAVVAGAALGVAGLLVQEGLRNPLAVPELLGVSSGAAAAVGIVAAWQIPVPGDVALVALVGGVLGGSACLLAANRAASGAAVLLAGAAVSAGLQAILLTALSLADSFSLPLLFRFLVGNLAGTGWADLGQPAIALTILAPIIVLSVPALSVLRLGDPTAAALGLNPRRARALVLGLAAALVAVVVPACGPIAWIGFAAPVVARRLAVRATPGAWLIWSAVAGALIVLSADLLARTVLYPVEVPVGALTAAVALTIGLVLRPRVDRA